MEYSSQEERDAGMSQEPFGLAMHELMQAAETGHDVASWRARFDQLDPRDDSALSALYAEIPKRPVKGWPFFEKSSLVDISAALPEARERSAVVNLPDKVRGAWFGRIAGNMLGKPVEWGWPRAQLTEYLRKENALPLEDYIPVDVARAEELGLELFEGVTRGRVAGGVRDDDIDYTVLMLHVLEVYGATYTREDVAREWLTRFPVYQLYTAERAAYNNLVREVPLADVAEFHNPFREWIGALIRADVFGYAHAGNPRAAAIAAYEDASLSHRANGIYGEMWAAALIASAFSAETPEGSIEASLENVPPTSRLSAEIRTVLDDFRAGSSWEATMDRLDARHTETSWVHTINNAGALTAAILWGDGQFSSTIGLAVLSGLDTDSIGATAGSWAGAYVGFDAIPGAWTEPLKDTTRSAVFGFDQLSISDLVARTLALRLIEAG